MTKKEKTNKKNKLKNFKDDLKIFSFYIKRYPQSLIKAHFYFIFDRQRFNKRLKELKKIILPVLPTSPSILNLILSLFSPQKILKGIKILFTQGPKGIIEKIKSHNEQINQSLTINQQYQIRLKKNYPTPLQLKKQSQLSKKFKLKPLISIITPVYNTKPIWLKKCINSVIDQSYQNWELCLINDCSTNKETNKLLSQLKNKDNRIKIKNLKKNVGISLASQEGLYMAKGKYIGLLDSDDELTPNALYEVVSLINKYPNADFIYSDEDKINEKGELYEPFFKPDWSPNLLLSMMYINHFTVYKYDLIKKIGGFNNKYNGSQDYDLALRISEETNNIFHIPKILYHWRAIPSSGAFKGDVKSYAIVNAKKALQDHLKRKKINAKVEKGVATGRWRIKYKIKNNPKVTIAMLTGGKINLLDKCLKSILQKSTYKNYSILIVDNSLKKETQQYLKKLKQKYPKKIQFYKDNLKPFNFPALYNKAFKKIKSKYAIILNDDTEVITPNWIESMLELIQRKDVAVVGCKLLYPDGRIQHAGVFMGVYGNTGHCFKGISNQSHYYFDFPHVIREVSAVTFACAMVKTKTYKELGGLDEKNLKVAFNDVDFCLRARKKGYSIIYTPYAVLYHYESVTKPVHFLKNEPKYMINKWKEVIKHDPFYNPNLTRQKEDFTLNI